MVAYYENAYRLDLDLALRCIEKASTIRKLPVDQEKFFEDLNLSVCMLVKEGNKYVFAHRSFQEYFSAVFLNECPEKQANKIFNSIAPRAMHDNVFSMLKEMDCETFERMWVLKRLRSVNTRLRKYGGKNGRESILDLVLNCSWDFVSNNGKIRITSYTYGFNGVTVRNTQLIMRLYEGDEFEIFQTLFDNTHEIGIDDYVKEKYRGELSDGKTGRIKIKFGELKNRGILIDEWGRYTDEMVKFLQKLEERIVKKYEERLESIDEIFE